jgi:hypothetical protein
MFEKEIKSITDFSINKIKKLGAYFTIEQLYSTGLHPSITRYIDAEMDYLIYLDRRELLQKSTFDYSNPAIGKYFSLITKEIKSNKKISLEDAKSLILQAVSFTANFLVRPKWSLTKFIYNEDQLKSVDEIRLSLNYLHYYDYLKNVLTIYIEKKNTPNFSLIDFEVALNKIDKELFVTHSHKLIDNALFSISEFFSMSGIDPNKISPGCVELFLKEKDQIDQLFKLRRALPVNAKRYYEINEIQNIIYTPGSLDKQIELPSRTEEEITLQNKKYAQEKSEELKSELIPESKPETVINDKKEPEVKIEEEQEIPEQEMFNFEENVKEEETETTEAEIESKAEVEPEEILFEKEEKQEPIEEETLEDETVEENEPDELDSLLEDEILSDISSNDDLLDSFDSQLKALEEESNLLLSEKEDISEVTETPDEKTESEPEEFEPLVEEKEGSKIGLETEGQNVIEKEETENELDEEEVEENEQPEENVNPVETVEPDKNKEKRNYSRAPQRNRDLFSFLSNKEIEKVVVNVFNEDREDFANTMEKITECFTYDEATEILKAVFFSYRVNPYTRDAVTLTNAISNYFSQAT